MLKNFFQNHSALLMKHMRNIFLLQFILFAMNLCYNTLAQNLSIEKLTVFFTAGRKRKHNQVSLILKTVIFTSCFILFSFFRSIKQN